MHFPQSEDIVQLVEICIGREEEELNMDEG
jgi:hypothetical protein